MDVDPASLLLFARVAETGSFSRAAERAGLPKSTVSRRIAELERQLGERLLLRTTRKLSLTDFGVQLLAHARQVAAEMEAVSALAQHRQSRPSGRLRVSMPNDAPLAGLPRRLADFLRRHPEVSLELDLSARRVDLIGEGFDLALRMGELAEDSSLVARRLFELGWGLYAAPGYLALRGTPQAPEELPGHDALALRGRTGEPVAWRLRRGAQRWDGLPPVRASANSPTLLLALAEQELGIAPVPDCHAALPVREGRLARVLPGWSLPAGTGWAVMPERSLMPEKTRAFLELLQSAVDEEGPCPG